MARGAEPNNPRTQLDGAEDTFEPTTSNYPPPMPGDPAAMGERRSRTSIVMDRLSRLSVPLFKPRWKPWSPGRVVSVTLAFAAVMSGLVAVTYRAAPMLRRVVLERFASPAQATEPNEGLGPVVTPAGVEPARADATLARERRSPIAGGLLAIPPSFASADGAYDLVIHFHGNTDLVEESYFTAKLNAVVVLLNLGNGSGPYEERFGNPLALPEVLDRAQTVLERRGLRHARRRRLALSAWSAGYGAVLKVLEQPIARTVDAVVLLDGIHIGYQPGSNELELLRLAPFERFARQAVEGNKLFSITHSNIKPIGHYAGTAETTDALLRAVGVERAPGGEEPAMPVLKSVEGVIARKKIVNLRPQSVARKGGLRVHGYAGDQPEHHMAHLIQMSETALPDLIEHWKAQGERR